MRLLGGKQRIICCVVVASFSNNGHKISSKTQNKWWMATGRRSIRDNDFFLENIVKNTLENP